jgi:hypothetical protein
MAWQRNLRTRGDHLPHVEIMSINQLAVRIQQNELLALQANVEEARVRIRRERPLGEEGAVFTCHLCYKGDKQITKNDKGKRGGDTRFNVENPF